MTLTSFYLLASLGLSCGLPNPGTLEQPTVSTTISVTLNREEARHFNQALAAIAAQTHLAVVAEGRPLYPDLTESVDLAMSPGADNLQAVVAKIADAYNYSVLKRNGVFLLRKRHTDPDDLPDVTIAECRQATQDLARLLAHFGPHFPQAQYGKPDPRVASLMTSLTDEQLMAMGLANLPFSALEPAQQEAVRRFALYFYVQSAEEGAHRIDSLFDSAVKPGTVLTHYTGAGVRYFGFDYAPDRPMAKNAFFPFSPQRYLGRTNLGYAMPSSVRYSGDAIKLTDPIDPTDPVASSDVPTMINAGKTLSIAQCIEDLKNTDYLLTVDDAPAAKPITVFGAESAAPGDILRGIAEVYGLRVRTDETNHELRLSRPSLRLSGTITELHDLVWRVLPAPVRTAFFDMKPPVGKPSGLSTATQNLQKSVQVTPTLQPLRNAAIRALRNSVEPRLTKSKDDKLPIEKLTPSEDAAFANALLLDAISDLRAFLHAELPIYLSDLDQAVLTGGVKENGVGKKLFRCYLEFRTANAQGGYRRESVGIGQIPYLK